MPNKEFQPLTSVEDMNAKLSAMEKLSFLYMTEIEVEDV